MNDVIANSIFFEVGSAPFITQFFFCFIFITSWFGLYWAISANFERLNDKDNIREFVIHAPLLAGFGGTVSSLYIAAISQNVSTDEAFISALGTSIYGVCVSLIVEMTFIVVKRFRK